MTTLKLQISFRVNEQPGKSFFFAFFELQLALWVTKDKNCQHLSTKQAKKKNMQDI